MADPLLLRLESALVDRLSSPLAPIPVQPFPADPAQWRMTHPQGQVLVLYQGSRWTDDGGQIVRQISWQVALVLRNLRTHTPGYAWLEIITGLINGWYPLPAEVGVYTGPFTVTADRFASQGEGLWYWEMDVDIIATLEPLDVSGLDDFLRWRDKFDIAPLNDEDTTPVADYEYFDAEDHVDLPGPD